MTDDNQVQTDKATLKELNDQIATQENEGDLQGLTDLIAPEFAFRRADGTIAGGAEFLKAVKRTDPLKDRRGEVDVDEIMVYGNRAIVPCIVTMTVEKDVNGAKAKVRQEYHNLRLFVRVEVTKDGQKVWEWKLLGWANEELPYKVIAA